MFVGTVPVVSGNNTVSVVAEDTYANTSTSRFQIPIAGTGASAPQYYGNGNLKVDAAGNSYTWDMKNELIGITYAAGGNSTFAYDAVGRKVQSVIRRPADRP